MEITLVPIESIKPYEANARKHPRKQIEKLARSIREYGFKNPLLVEPDGTIICGHGRLEAAKNAGLAEVPCIVASDLTPSQIKQYRLADNKIGDMSAWDMNMLGDELLGIEFDMSVFDFDIAETIKPNDYKQSKNLDNLFKADFKTTNEWGVPETETFTGDVESTTWVSFGEKAKITAPENVALHFYIDDYKFESVWTAPDKWIELFRRCKAVVTPDFSNYTDMPKAQQLWNQYRRQWCARYWQERGVNIISSLSWANGQIYDWSFAGIPKGTTCATSFVGDGIDKRAGIDELRRALDIVEPARLFIKAGIKDMELLAKHFDCGFIDPYSWKG